MKGQVLGFDGATGAITGEDGARYGFVLADWKGSAPPKPRDQVDFVATAGSAQEIYPMAASFGASLGGLGENAPDLTNARAFIATRPQVIVEAVVLISALLFNFASSAMAGVAAIGFPGMMSQMAGSFTQAGQFGGMMAGTAVAPPSTGWLQFMSVISYLLWLIPVGAALAIFLDVTNKRNRLLELSLGALCVASLAIFFLSVQAFSSLMTAMAGPFGNALSNAIGFGFGGFVLVACGVLLLLTGTGKIARTPGL